MTIIRPNKMPAFWWLCPWAYARTLHMSANAMKAYADRLDGVLDIQRSIIEDQSKEISTLKVRIAALAAIKRAADINDAVIRGKAIIPDAEPHE